MDELFLCRHGETAWTISGQHTGSTDIPLTGKGRQEALALGQKLKKYRFTKIYSSPMQRAAETCKLAGFDPIMEPNAVEWNYGDYEGLDHEQIMEADPSWDIFTKGAPGGETPEDVGRRADLLIDEFLEQSGSVAVFSHGHFLRVLAARWLGLNPKLGKLFSLSVASLSILGYERNSRVIKLWNDVCEL